MTKILVIEDDQGIKEAIRAILESEEYEVEASDNINGIFKQPLNELPKVILLDLLLSGKDGRQIAKSLKANDKTAHIPIIMLSAHPDAKKAAFESGADDFIPKPFDMFILLEKIKSFI